MAGLALLERSSEYLLCVFYYNGYGMRRR